MFSGISTNPSVPHTPHFLEDGQEVAINWQGTNNLQHLPFTPLLCNTMTDSATKYHPPGLTIPSTYYPLFNYKEGLKVNRGKERSIKEKNLFKTAKKKMKDDSIATIPDQANLEVVCPYFAGELANFKTLYVKMKADWDEHRLSLSSFC